MKRLTIDVGDKIDSLLTDLATSADSTKAEIIRRALASYAYLKKHAKEEEGTKVSITDQTNTVVKDVVLP